MASLNVPTVPLRPQAPESLPSRPVPESTLALAGARRQLATIRGNGFFAVTEMISFIESLPKEERYNVQVEMRDQLLAISEGLDNVVDSFYRFAKDDSAWRGQISEKEFKEDWQHAEEVSTRVTGARNKGVEARRKIEQAWGVDIVNKHFSEGSTGWLAAVRKVVMTNRLTFEQA